MRDKVNLIVPDLPETAEATGHPESSTPTPRPSCASPSPRRARLRDVTDIADKQIKKRIESINGVGNVQIVGGARARDSRLG